MNRLTSISLTVIVMVTTTAMPQERATRSMQAAKSTTTEALLRFDPAQSVALFVGARTFHDDGSLEMVPYSVDDAVDLAYTFALDPRVALVRPKHVALALSDPTPRKAISQRRLAELKKRGAIIGSATQSQILKLLSMQAGAAGPDGIFIVAFASHGFSDDGSQFLLAANSLLRELSSAIPAARIFDIVAKSKAARSLILIDTCRERMLRQRATAPEERSAAPLIRQMGLTEGQVVLYAAAAGKWAYDDDSRQNGVFTGAVLDGLQCRAGHDRSGMVTVDMLAATVERSVLTWIRTNLDPSMRNATQASIDGAARMMPLAMCSHPPPADPPPLPEVVPAPKRPASRTPLRQLMEDCRTDGKALLSLYESHSPDRFVTTYLRWRDACVSVLREVDDRLPQVAARETETNRFLAIASFWCTTKCPPSLSAGNCALFQETSRAERCFWDLNKAVKQVDEVLIRNALTLQGRSGERR